MNLLKFFTVVFVAALTFTACQNSLDDEKLNSNELQIEKYLNQYNLEYTKNNGIYHAIRVKGFGYNIVAGDSIAFWYVAYTLNEIVFDTNIKEVATKLGIDQSTRNFNPIATIAGKNNLLEGLSKGILLCRERQWGTIMFPSSLGFAGNTVGMVNPWTPLAYDIYIIYVKNEKIDQEQNNINNFVANSQGFIEDSTGLRVKFLQKNEIDLARPTLNDTIYGWYKCSTFDNSVIEELPIEGQEIVLNNKDLIEGLKYGFMLMNPGEWVQMVVPSPLGYGIEGSNFVNPYTPLLLELRLDSIK